MIALLGNSAFFVTRTFWKQDKTHSSPFRCMARPAVSIKHGPNGIRIDGAHSVRQFWQTLGKIVDNGYEIAKDDGSLAEHSGDLSTLVVD